eukprot:3646413-Rhodomonas_salina.2
MSRSRHHRSEEALPSGTESSVVAQDGSWDGIPRASCRRQSQSMRARTSEVPKSGQVFPPCARALRKRGVLSRRNKAKERGCVAVLAQQ